MSIKINLLYRISINSFNISVSVMQRQQHYTIIVKAFEAFRPWLRRIKLISLQVLYVLLHYIFLIWKNLLMDVLDYVSEYDSVVSVFESKMSKLHTTHSWDFLRLGIDYNSNHIAIDSTSNVIVGVIDSGNYFLQYILIFLSFGLLQWLTSHWFSGVWPESESFSDYGIGPVPEKFKGECVTGDNFTLANCNK